ncbi:hypothetical protein CHUAL_012297 [Chamberlinius hualienensis]
MALAKVVVRAQGSEDAEEEPELVDPQVQLREQCSKKSDCNAFQEKLQECNDRVNSKTKTTETCVEELFDFLHCVDHCVSKKLFNYLK